MLCLRCGRCCIHLDVFIVNPLSILPDGRINLDVAGGGNAGSMIFKPAGEICPHLKFIPGDSRENERDCTSNAMPSRAQNSRRDGWLAVCTIHHLLCYGDTPCDRFEQIGPEDAVCLMSGYFRSLDGSPQP